MAPLLTVHYDNGASLTDPHLWGWYAGSAVHDDVAPSGEDDFGLMYEVPVRRPAMGFTFKQGPGVAGPWEPGNMDRSFQPLTWREDHVEPAHVWCRAGRAFVYPIRPAAVDPVPADARVRALFGDGLDQATRYLARTGGLCALGANLLPDGRGVLFGLYHPTAARVHVAGTFNGWQRPGRDDPDPDVFVPLSLHRGYFGAPNVWLGVAEAAAAGDEYKFFVEGGVGRDAKGRHQLFAIDPYARQLANDFHANNPVVHDPSAFSWNDEAWRTPDAGDLILYELSVHGFTEADPDVPDALHGRYAGITERIRRGYFSQLGVNALSLMPLAEVPSMQGPHTLGYDPSIFFTVERDFGSPDDLRELVDAAHTHGLAVVVDLVFNHTSNSFNPLWGLVLEHPREETEPGQGGLYFSGSTPWGNRVATERADVQHMLIDVCRFLTSEYHVDGFRFDATRWVDQQLLLRLASEVRADKPDTLLIAEHLPNEPHLNLEGWNGYAQWCDLFHDKLKSVLCERPLEGQHPDAERMGDVFYFSKGVFAAHTNNVVNYVESHDEHTIAHELAHSPWLNHPDSKERKGRLGVFATAVALGQPMLYMGQEFNEERPRNIVTVDWPPDLDQHSFFQWCRRLLHLRHRYPGLRMSGFDPAPRQFDWIAAPWLDGRHGGGRNVIGWRARPTDDPFDTLVVLLNFEPADVTVDLELGLPGRWVKLADIDRVDDLPPVGGNSAHDPTALESVDGRFAPFTLPSSSGFVYKWEASV